MKTRIIAITLLAMLTLSGCSSEQQGDRATPVPHIVKLADGRAVTCIVFKSGYAGGMSCDWDDTK